MGNIATVDGHLNTLHRSYILYVSYPIRLNACRR